MQYTPSGKTKQEMKRSIPNMEGQVASQNYIYRLKVCLCKFEKNLN